MESHTSKHFLSIQIIVIVITYYFLVIIQINFFIYFNFQ